jgi:hypothetical protein
MYRAVKGITHFSKQKRAVFYGRRVISVHPKPGIGTGNHDRIVQGGNGGVNGINPPAQVIMDIIEFILPGKI